MTVVNEVGVDPNRLLEHPHTVALLQFVCGLGPRKASSLLKVHLNVVKYNSLELSVSVPLWLAVSISFRECARIPCAFGPNCFLGWLNVTILTWQFQKRITSLFTMLKSMFFLVVNPDPARTDQKLRN